nr:LysR family transcriptional regulator [Nesterenkonia sp. Act20]
MSRLDLNLLLALDALLTERNVTRAASRLWLSQPALSASLARLREHFDDELLIRRGSTNELTPLAAELIDPVNTALRAAVRVFDAKVDWDPRLSHREFVFYGSDHAFTQIGAELSRIVSAQAPGVRLRFMLHDQKVVEDATRSLRAVDAMFLPHGYVSGFPHLDLWRDRWVVIADPENRLVEEGDVTEALSQATWVATLDGLADWTVPGGQLRALGVEPRVAMLVESFSALPHVVAGTNRLAVMQEGVATEAEARGTIKILPAPLFEAELLNAVWWHPAHEGDPEHQWLRAQLRKAAQALGTRLAHNRRQ